MTFDALDPPWKSWEWSANIHKKNNSERKTEFFELYEFYELCYVE